MQYNRRWFRTGTAESTDYLEPVEMTFGEELQPAEVDETDLKILRMLANNARMKLKELSTFPLIAL